MAKINTEIQERPEDKRHENLVRYCIDLYKEIGKSTYRKATIANIQEAREVYEQKPKDTNFPWPKACFHEDVEVLTESGWEYVKNVNIGDEVYSREPISGLISLKEVNETQVFDAPKEGLIRLKNLFFDIQVTDNHRFHLESRKNPVEKQVTALEILEGFDGQTNYHLPLTGEWNAESAITLWGYDPSDFLTLLGWYISEGWSYKSRSIGISQSEKANPEKVAQIAVLLDRMGFCYKFNGNVFLINIDQDIAKHLDSLGNKYEKTIPKMYLDLPPEQLKYLFDSLIAGDGHIAWHKDKHRNHPGITYYTTSKQLADDFQELCMKLGYSSCVNEKQPVLGGKIRGRKITGSHTGYCDITRI